MKGTCPRTGVSNVSKPFPTQVFNIFQNEIAERSLCFEGQEYEIISNIRCPGPDFLDLPFRVDNIVAESSPSASPYSAESEEGSSPAQAAVMYRDLAVMSFFEPAINRES